MIPSWSMELKKALDQLLEAYTPETTLNDINLILSEDPCICIPDEPNPLCESCF